MLKYFRNTKFGDLPLHPFLLAVCPILFYYSRNIVEVESALVLIRPTLAVLALTGILFGLFYLLFRRLDRAALLASALSLSYIKFLEIIVKTIVSGLDLLFDFPGGLLRMFLFVGLLLLSIYLAFRVKSVPLPAGTFLNGIACGIFFMPILTIVLTQLYGPPEEDSDPATFAIPEAIAEREDLPDIYYIILDGYARADVLADRFGHDNTPFLNAMKERGFFVAEASASSYLWTEPSLCATLNMDYLQNINIPEADLPNQKQAIRHRLRHNAVHPLLQKLGYTLMGTGSGKTATTPPPYFDVIIEYDPPWTTPTAFEVALMEFTPFSQLVQFLGVNMGESNWSPRLNYVVQNLDAPTRFPERRPIYFQCHLLAPHDPFVMRADGTFVQNQFGKLNFSALKGGDENFEVAAVKYIEEVRGTNGYILSAVDRILKNSTTPPIIAILSDHGPRVDESTEIMDRSAGTLFMLHIPGADPGAFPHDVNPVELFPIILNEGLGFDIPMPKKAPDDSSAQSLTSRQ